MEEIRHSIERSDLSSDAAMFARFLMTPVLNSEKSKAMGHEVWEDKEAIELTWDNGDSQLHYVLREKDGNGEPDIKSEEFKARFADHYRAFKAGCSQKPIGTPLEHLFRSSPSKVKHYEYRNIYTVEQLAAISDENLQGCGMGGLEDRKDAQKFLQVRNDNYAREQIDIQVNAMKAENDELKDQLAEMNRQLGILMSSKEATEGKNKKK